MASRRAPGSGPSLDPGGALLKAVLVHGTEPVPGENAYPSPSTGFGVLRLRRALPLQGDARRLHLVDVRHAVGLTTGDEALLEVEVTDDREPFGATLVWFDPPGVPGSEDPVVNDLDLGVTGPDERLFRGNHFVDGFSVIDGQADKRNTVERVRVERPRPGTWRLVVRAGGVNVGSPGQGYALVASGALSPAPPV